MLKTTFTGEKDAIRFGVIGGAYLIDTLTHMTRNGCTMLAYMLHFFKDSRSVFIRQSQKEISYRPCSARSVIVTPL